MESSKSRNSVLELIRIISVMGIIGLHIYGTLSDKLSNPNIFIRIVYCDIFELAVPMFLLISGYFSVSFSVKKITRLHLMVVTYSLVNFCVRMGLHDYSIGPIDLVRFVFPIISYRYWYFSCYFLLLLFSPILNHIVNSTSRKMLGGMLIIWMVIVNTVNIHPFFGFVDDYFWKVLFYYFAGGYLHKYGLRLFRKASGYLYAGIALIVAAMVANVLMTLAYREPVMSFSYDSFIMNELAAIFIFYYCSMQTMNNAVIDKIATYVPAVYLGESTIRFVIEKFLFRDSLGGSPVLVLIIFAIEIFIFMCIIVVERIRRFFERPIEKSYSKIVEKAALVEKFEGFLEKAL